MSFHHSAPLSFRAKPRNLSRWLAVAARTAPLRPHFTPLVSGLDPQPRGAARLPPNRRRQPPPATLHQPSFRTRSGIQGSGAPALPDTNRSTRRPVTGSSRRTVQDPPDVARNLKYLLQADDHIAVRFVVVFPSMRVSKKVPPEQSAIMSFLSAAKNLPADTLQFLSPPPQTVWHYYEHIRPIPHRLSELVPEPRAAGHSALDPNRTPQRPVSHTQRPLHDHWNRARGTFPKMSGGG